MVPPTQPSEIRLNSSTPLKHGAGGPLVSTHPHEGKNAQSYIPIPKFFGLFSMSGLVSFLGTCFAT